MTPGLQLDSPKTATTVRVQDGKTLTTDGPFVEIKEAIGGYLLSSRRPRRRDRVGLADPCGPPRRGVEVRPIVEWVGILDQVFREQWGYVLAALIGFLGEVEVREEAAQEGSRSPPSAGRD